MGTNSTGCTEWERDYDPMTEQPKPKGGDLMHNAPIRDDLFDGTLNGYQKAAQHTAIYPGKGTFWGLVYAALKGSGEVGEFNEKVGKLLRDDGLLPNDPIEAIDLEKREALVMELGDELWYLAAKCNELKVSLEEVAIRNIQKLKSRQERGTLSGSGDNR